MSGNPKSGHDETLATGASEADARKPVAFEPDRSAGPGKPGSKDERNDPPDATQQGRITMAVGLAEDAKGVQQVLIGTSEPMGYLRPGVTLNPGELLVPGLGHAETDIISFSQLNGYYLFEIGATRPICPSCAISIQGIGAVPITPLKVP